MAGGTPSASGRPGTRPPTVLTALGRRRKCLPAGRSGEVRAARALRRGRGGSPRGPTSLRRRTCIRRPWRPLAASAARTTRPMTTTWPSATGATVVSTSSATIRRCHFSATPKTSGSAATAPRSWPPSATCSWQSATLPGFKSRVRASRGPRGSSVSTLPRWRTRGRTGSSTLTRALPRAPGWARARCPHGRTGRTSPRSATTAGGWPCAWRRPTARSPSARTRRRRR
mmetsp:Transcript_71226/g.201848  ORF Transcript_71226/g.201848 Transcript_71226/m.201848 type:complete len:228 (-) Transcript_71226:270-953(-)